MGVWSRFKKFFTTPAGDARTSPQSGKKKPAAQRKPPARVVRAAPLSDRFTGEERGGGWAYFYRAEGDPILGQRVIVPFGFENEEEFRIIGFGRNGYKGPLKSITKLPR